MAFRSMRSLFVLGTEDFRLLRDLIYRKSGLAFSESSKVIFERRLGTRLQALRLADFRQYYQYLQFDSKREDELETLFELLTTNETYFFREDRQLRAFSGEILTELHEQNASSRILRIWSAGCSTGEEPYTIAMLIHESGLFEGWDVDVFGTDINQSVLASARKGSYRESSFRVTPQSMRSKYFTPDGDRLMKVNDDIKAMVSFGKVNLFEDHKAYLIGKMDVIFCRNVIIYFDQESRVRVIDLLYDKLRYSGYLLLGHAESLLNVSTKFRLRHLKTDMVYQK